MAGKIMGFFKELKLGLSIITTAIGLFLLFMGVIWYWFRSLKLGFYTDIINSLEDWNAYLFGIGFVILATGVWYLYSYIKHRKFLLKEIKTNKRSELLKKHGELEDAVKHLPSKYKKMLESKKEELRIE